MDFEKLKEELIRDEGKYLMPYTDSVGKLTIGIGRNLDDVGLSDLEAIYLLDNDITRALDGVLVIVGATTWESLTENRKRVLVNMCFNLGQPRLALFKRMLGALERGDFKGTAVEMLDSKWARQVGKRAIRLANRMRSG